MIIGKSERNSAEKWIVYFCIVHDDLERHLQWFPFIFLPKAIVPDLRLSLETMATSGVWWDTRWLRSSLMTTFCSLTPCPATLVIMYTALFSISYLRKLPRLLIHHAQPTLALHQDASLQNLIFSPTSSFFSSQRFSQLLSRASDLIVSLITGANLKLLPGGQT